LERNTPVAQDNIQVVKVDDATFFIADLFQRTFGDPPPLTPAHYVAFCKLDSSTFEAVGYYHVTFCGEYALVGGLCVDEHYRNKGIGEKLERIVFEDGGETKAFFAYVGSPTRARRVGFVDTNYEHLMVRWMKAVSAVEQERILAEVAALGPF
jgi:hypothetical protein